jgi:nitroreductase
MELDEAIFNRRSVRKFSDYHVTDEDIRTLMEAARWAPSWANTQAWEFIVIRDRALIEKVVGTYVEKNPATRGSLDASALIVACARTGVSGCYRGQRSYTSSELVHVRPGMAVQNLCLKAHSMGLGTVIVGFMNHDACGEMLGLPEGYEAVAAIPVGQPASAARAVPPRKDQSSFVHRDKFGQRF